MNFAIEQSGIGLPTGSGIEKSKTDDKQTKLIGAK